MVKMKKMGSLNIPMGWTVVLFLCAAALSVGTVGGATVVDQCANEVQKVQMCLTYATGQAATPSKECCTSVADIKDKNPVCLCYIIQQAHKGNDQLKSLGIQEARLLQLPSACKLTNASASDCPKLLNLPPGSPDSAIFANSSSATATATTTSPSSASDQSNGSQSVIPQLAGLVAISVAVFLYSFPAVSAFYT